MPTSVGRIMQRDESRQPAEAAGNEADEADKFEREEAEQQSRSHAREAERRAREQRQRTRHFTAAAVTVVARRICHRRRSMHAAGASPPLRVCRLCLRGARLRSQV